MDCSAFTRSRARALPDDLAKLMGYPGKLGMDGSAVRRAWQEGRIAEIRDYRETDVVNTYLVHQASMARGTGTPPRGRRRETAREALGRIDAPH